MPLTLRSNGSSGSNLVGAAWWNDYYNLLTGAMPDQPVTINNTMVLKGLGGAPSTAMSAALVASSTGLGVGAYKYVVTYSNGPGETLQSPVTSITTTTGNQHVSLTAIPTGPAGTTARNLYRTKVGGSVYYLLHQLADNTTTTYTDSTADTALGTTNPPTHSTFGGALIVKDYNNVTQLTIGMDGSIISNASPSSVVINGSTSGTLTANLDLGNGLKRIAFFWNNFQNGATGSTLILPTPFTLGAHVDNGNGIGFGVNLAGGSTLTVYEQTGFQSSGSTTRIDPWLMADINAPFDRIVVTSNNSTAHTGWTIFTGV